MSDNLPRLWVLNFDAELELADPNYSTPTTAMRERMRSLQLQIKKFIHPRDRILEEHASPQQQPMQGVAWCPTPRAIKLLTQTLKTPPSAPTFEALRTVNHRRFCARIGQILPGASFVDDITTLEQLLACPSITGSWLLKRPLGFSGRGQLRVDPGPLSEGTRRWAEPGLRRGEGLQVEPLLKLEEEFAIHGMLHPDGAFFLGEPTRQHCSAHGVWEHSEPAGEALLVGERKLLEAEAYRVANELYQASYFGPFNLDAFAWRDREARRFNPRSEINARFTMGWFIGMRARSW